MRFVQFLLNEARVGAGMQLKPLDVAATVQLLKTKCQKNSARFLDQTEEPHTQIWRGGYRTAEHSMSTVDPSATERRSENTSNYYTVIFDNLPSRSHFPKRSRSMIATNSYDTARGFGRAVRVIPFDNTPIGVVNRPDLWNGRIGHEGIEGLNPMWSYLVRMVSASLGESLGDNITWGDFLNFDRVDDDTVDTISSRLSEFDVDVAFIFQERGIVAALEHMYGKMLEPAHTLVTNTADLPPTNTEVWIGGPVVLLHGEAIDDVIYYAREGKLP